MSDQIRPAYYGGPDNPFEVIKVFRAWFGEDIYCAWLRLTVLKYLARAGKKPSADEIEDIAKAQFYLGELLESLRRQRAEAAPVETPAPTESVMMLPAVSAAYFVRARKSDAAVDAAVVWDLHPKDLHSKHSNFTWDAPLYRGVSTDYAATLLDCTPRALELALGGFIQSAR